MNSKIVAKKVPKKTVRPVRMNAFPIVAIGASAGGLEAITLLFKNLPSNTGMAFIYVQHLSPNHKSMLTEIVSRITEMPVKEIVNMEKIVPNKILIIPYNSGIEVTDGHIKLVPRTVNKTPDSIDVLFTSLAISQKERVIGIVMSGTGSDGSKGIQAIKQEGGLTFAQDNTAKYSSMPMSAIASETVDCILSPKEMAVELLRLSKHPYVINHAIKAGNESLIEDNDPDLKIILHHLQKSIGVDFGAYKMNTIKRRVIRRMLLLKIKSLKEYAAILAKDNNEVITLYHDLLIHVTSFFRDANTYKYLKNNLLPNLLKSEKLDGELRIWVPACSTGEEAYSIAMMLIEIQESSFNKIPVQIFATDLSPQVIAKARMGIYTAQDLESVSQKRIQKFFTVTENGYRITKQIREMCVFAAHNILNDPPFSHIDFVSCCNLFIYLDQPAQKRALNTIHYALNDSGYLMLGKSESVSAAPQHFAAYNKAYKIFSRKNNSGNRKLPELPKRKLLKELPKPNIIENNIPALVSKKANLPVNRGLDSAIDSVLVSEFMPPSVVINYQMEILQFRGSTDIYLTHASGKATFNILKMARPEMTFELRNAIAKSIKTKSKVRKTGIELKLNNKVLMVSIEIVPLKIDWNEPLLLILFSEQEQIEIYIDQGKGSKKSTLHKDRRIKKLEEELRVARADSLTFSQEQEAFTEELQSTNEEIVSSNEELQTVNEELETSKEEIESANEELISTNQEMQIRNELLNESYQYSEAIVATMHEPMIVLDKDLRVKSANKSFYIKFGVAEKETEGALLYDLGNKQWNIPKLRELLEDIIPRNSQFREFEVTHTFQNIGEKIMLLNASRIIQKTQREQLILLAIQDITEIRKLVVEKELREKKLLGKEIIERKAVTTKLENAVEERTKDLKLANEELGKINKELEAFTYVSSHDLQEPLRKIQTFAGRILEKENQNLSESGKNYFHLMQNAAERMQQLILDLLAFSRLNTADRKFETTDLNTIIEEVKKEFKESLEDQHARIDVKESCQVNIIPFQFRQLMHNLISNALKFSNPKRPIRIVIKSENVKFNKANPAGLPLNKTFSHISIADNGIGFENEYSEKIFEVFQRLHGKDEYAGTGIGLAIVKKIIENHKGFISAKSKLNKGTTFDIYIPADK